MDNILVIVEGEKTESRFFKQIQNLTKNELHIIPYRANIYHLYQCMKKEEYIDTIDMLIHEDNNISQAHKDLLKQNFNRIPYIYLIFDFDFQDTKGKKDIKLELFKIQELLKYFTNEADGKGKLLMNYPMMESYRDLKNFHDESYLDLMVEVDDDYKNLTCYKEQVGARGMQERIDSFTDENFASLVRMNLKKINYLIYNNKECPKKDEYFHKDNFSQIKIYEKQLQVLHNDNKIVVFNSAILLYLELKPNILESL